MIKSTFLIVFFFSIVITAQNISGNLKGLPFNVSLENVVVTLKDKQTGNLLGSDTSNQSGDYSIDYTLVEVNDENSLPDNFYLSNAYPNPFNPQTKIDFNTPKSGKYSVRIYNIIGELVFNRDFNLEVGFYSFNVSGLGAAGVYLFNISGSDFTSTQKLLLLDGGNRFVNIQLTNSSSSALRKQQLTDLLLELRRNDFFEKDTILLFQQFLVVNIEMNQIPTQIQKTVTGQQTNLQTSEPVKNANYVLKDEDGNVLKQGQLNNQGQINENFKVNKYYWAPLDSTIYSIDTLLVELSKSFYDQKIYSKPVNEGSQINISGQMNHQGREHTFNLRNYDVSGFDIDSMTVSVITPDGNVLVQQQNNTLPVDFTEFHDDPLTEVQIKNLNPEYLQWVSVTTTEPYIKYLFQNVNNNQNLVVLLQEAETQGTMEAYWVPARVNILMHQDNS